MKKFTLIFAMALVAASGMANAEMHDMSQHQMATQPLVSSAMHQAQGVIKAVNVQAQKIQIAHEAIPTLKWPAMTMWFVLRDSLPENIRVGDAVRFDLEQNTAKKWIVTHIEKK